MTGIYQAITGCMLDIEAISKKQRNQAQGYQFRGIDDVYNELHDVLAKHGVFTVSELLWERSEDRTSAKGTALIYRVLALRYTFYCSDGSSVQTTVVGEGMDSGDKASNKAMAVAHKYAFMQVFCIPTEEAKDPEHESHSLKPAFFTGQPEQKRILLKIFEAQGVIDRDQMARIASVAVSTSTPMANLSELVAKELLNAG